MRILIIGDIVARPGRRAVQKVLPRLRAELGVDFCIANAENLAGGAGMTRATVEEVLEAGVDVLTGGNHTWDQKEGILLLDENPRLLRPANYPPGTPGRGWRIYPRDGGPAVGVLNLQGRIFLPPIDCPFRVADEALEAMRRETSVIVVDIHAEATAEKQALGYHLEGRVSAVVGTHTHVPTADAVILEGGTAYVTDLGMTGAYDGVLGVRKDQALSRFLTRLPVRFGSATGRVQFWGLLLEVEESSGRALSLSWIREDLP
jgi:hypothetical protein